jgi:bifunctional non-homologous end joining protein LigD
MQNYQKTQKGDLRYCVFDIIWLDGRDLRKLPLSERKRTLKKILPRSKIVNYSDHVIGEGVEFFKAAKRQNLEGVMAKDSRSPYRTGLRTGDWLKIKTHMQQEAVICGFTEPRGGRKYFGALVLGIYDKGKLVYIGHTGGGFNFVGLKELYARLKKLAQKQSPFDKPPKTNAPVTWVKPKLVCEVKFGEWTSEGQMRQPIFLGLRVDKKPTEVIRE